MFSRPMFSVLFGTLLIITIVPDTASYNKYGRTCNDIGCRSDETCVMAEDPCTAYSDKCGRYPTCQRISGASCTTMICGENEYCKNENGAPKCVRKSTGLTLPPGQVSYRTTSRVPSPPPRSSSYGGRYSGHFGSRNTVGDGSILSYRTTPRAPSPPPRSSSNGGRYSGHSGTRNTIGDGSIFNRLFGDDRQPRPTSSSRIAVPTGNNYYETHTHVDSNGNRVWTFSENDEIETRAIPKRDTGHQTEAEPSDTSKNSDGQLYPKSSGYPSGSGYPSSSGHSSSGSSDFTSTDQPRSGYPSSGSSGYPSSGSSGYPSSGSSGYPSSGSSGYPSSGSSGYPSSGSSGYPSSGSSGYPSSRSSSYPSSGSSGYPSSGSSGYPSSGSSGYPSSGSSGYPSSGSSGYPSSGSSGYPSSGLPGYPSRGSSGYPTRSGSSSSNSGSSGYPDNSGNSYNEQTVRRTSANNVNAAYPSYPSYPHPSVYPERNPSRSNYPSQNAGYPSSGYPYNNQQRPPYANQGYPQNYPQGRYQEGYYPGQNYITTTKRPGIRDQLTNLARNVAERVLTQTIVDRVTGRH
ncbi:ice nucleation protein isoform X2 [Polyergus mexicanus]|uniref:ice nucleation protein isoform X2 n=1 Tax=Polyergus mexicanus TaxID=615972 RepID=UPI0038B5CFFF